MTFFGLMGGVFVFGLLAIFFPRASFMVMLALFLKATHYPGLFKETSLMITVASLFLLIGTVLAFLGDILTIKWLSD